MKKIVFLTTCSLLLCCSLPDPGCDDHSCDASCTYVLEEHPKKMFNSLRLNCPYKGDCSVWFYFGIAIPKTYNECEKRGFSYTFVKGDRKETVKETTTLKNIPVDSDGHVRFSLFDKTNTEKNYDIDLSEIIHSYTVRGDSVEIRMPVGDFSMSIRCPFCVSGNKDSSICEGLLSCQYHGDETESKVVMIGTDSTWSSFFGFDYYLLNQSSMASDSIKVYGEVYFREK